MSLKGVFKSGGKLLSGIIKVLPSVENLCINEGINSFLFMELPSVSSIDI
ncbi:MAG: hypothetical protein DHS20C07_19000 [Methyloligella sp.]|nr:MAG: hypothetical protein DHS20C07_19000 [Methyloligella sp.]